jgi:hypothetical protein
MSVALCTCRLPLQRRAAQCKAEGRSSRPSASRLNLNAGASGLKLFLDTADRVCLLASSPNRLALTGWPHALAATRGGSRERVRAKKENAWVRYEGFRSNMQGPTRTVGPGSRRCAIQMRAWHQFLS